MGSIEKLKRLLNNEYNRKQWVVQQLKNLPMNSKLLDAGCGSQQYRSYCKHIQYFAQDFGKFRKDEQDSMTALHETYHYGKLDYVGDIWNIDEKNQFFDAILCTEVLEHIPYPNTAIAEFSRLLKPGGKLILTVPANSLRHMDPYYFYSGFSNRYLDLILKENNFDQICIEPVGSYHAWLMVEAARCMRHEGFWAILFLCSSFFYHYLKQKNAKLKEINTLCFGYHVTAVKKPNR